MGQPSEYGTPWHYCILGCSELYQGPILQCPVCHEWAIKVTDIGLTARTRNTVELYHSRVFRGMPRAHIQVSHLPMAGHECHNTLDCGLTMRIRNILESDTSCCSLATARVFRLLSVGWNKAHRILECQPLVEYGTPWNYCIPGCSVLYQGLTFRCPVCHMLAAGVTRHTGLWANRRNMGHPGMG